MFSVSSPYALPIFLQLQSYIRQPHQTIIPLVTFLPDRLRDPNTNAVNLSNFRNVARVLHDNESVSIHFDIETSNVLTTRLIGWICLSHCRFPHIRCYTRLRDSHFSRFQLDDDAPRRRFRRRRPVP